MFQQAVITVSALGFSGMGVAAVWTPVRVTEQFGIPELSADGRNEVRAVYGGFGLAVACGLTLSLFMPAWRAPACAAVAVALGGMALGRVGSALIDRHLGRFPAFYFCLEACAAVALTAAAFT